MALALFALTILAISTDLRADDEWGKGITIKTSWKEAIAECKATGKLLFIYNGWQNKNI